MFASDTLNNKYMNHFTNSCHVVFILRHISISLFVFILIFLFKRTTYFCLFFLKPWTKHQIREICIRGLDMHFSLSCQLFFWKENSSLQNILSRLIISVYKVGSDWKSPEQRNVQRRTDIWANKLRKNILTLGRRKSYYFKVHC